MKYNDNGEYKDIYVKAFDTLPVGTEVDFDGSVVPSGWTEIPDPNTYSTDEVRIGTWIDGNPLYRKSFTLNSDFSTWQNVSGQLRYTFSSNINNIKNIWFDESASFCNFNNNYVTSINNYNKENDYMKCNINTQTGNLQIFVPSAYNTITATIVITVKYTKTTD